MKRSALACILLILASCAPQPMQEQPISIGAILSLTGNDLAGIFIAMQEGADLAVDEINAKGGVLGRPLQIIYEDDQLNSAKATTAAQKLLAVDKVPASLIGGANTAKAAGTLFEEAHVPLVVLWDVNEDLENLGEYTYGIGYHTEGAGRKMAELLYAKGASSAAIIRHLDEWSQLIATSFAQRFTELGGTIITDESVDVGVTDFKTTLLKAKPAAALYAPLVGQLDILFKQARDLGYAGLLATGDSMTEDVANAAGSAAEGVYFTQVSAPDNALLQQLRTAYAAKYGKEPELIEFTALGYDGVRMLAEAMQRAQSADAEKTHTELYAIQGFEGAAGTISIQETGFAAKYEPAFVIKDGKMQPAE